MRVLWRHQGGACGYELEEGAKRANLMNSSLNLARKEKKKLAFFLKEYPETCCYCLSPAECKDHLSPKSYSGKHSVTVPACGSCNSLLNDFPNPSIEARKEYIKRKLLRRNRKLLARKRFTSQEINSYGPNIKNYLFKLEYEKRLLLIRLRNLGTIYTPIVGIEVSPKEPSVDLKEPSVDLTNEDRLDLLKAGVKMIRDESKLSREWVKRARCKGRIDLTGEFFVDSKNIRQVEAIKNLCRKCPVRFECLQYGYETGSEGIWGGTTENERSFVYLISKAFLRTQQDSSRSAGHIEIRNEHTHPDGEHSSSLLRISFQQSHSPEPCLPAVEQLTELSLVYKELSQHRLPEEFASGPNQMPLVSPSLDVSTNLQQLLHQNSESEVLILQFD